MKFLLFDQVISDVTSKFKKIKNSQYQQEGRFFIIDQGKEHIAGYTDDETLINKELTPIIVFGDHTKIFKYERSPIALGADGAKALWVDPTIGYDLYVFLFLKFLKLKDAGYSRHFKFLKEVKIPIPHNGENPAIDEQIRIATLLSRVEALIATRKDNLRLLDEFLKSTFLEMFGDPVRNERGWNVIPFSKIGHFISGGTPSKEREDFWSGTFPWVSPKDMKISYLADAQDHVSEKVFKETSLKRIRPGHLLIVVRGMILAHSFPTAINTAPVAINQDMKAIYPNDNVKVHYLMACLDAMKRQVLTLISSAGHGTKKFDTLAMDKVMVPSPPVEIQNKFASIAEKVESLKALYQHNLNELENLYNVLSQKAFKGELDLSRIPLTPIKANGQISAPLPSIQGVAVVGKAMSHPMAREKLLRRLFARFIAENKGTSFSLKEFWSFVERKVLDHTDENSPPLGVADYDQAKQWLFDLLKSGGVAQHFNEASNRLELNVSA